MATEVRRSAIRPDHVMVLFVLVALVGGLWLLGRPHPAEPIPASDTGAWTVCQKFVSQELKAPSTAKYPRQSQATITALTPLRYRVTSYVDAQNSFGAMLRQPFVCEAVYDGNDQWTRALVKIG